jgi:hypothetical protein
MPEEFDIILVRRGLRSEITNTTLLVGELGLTVDTNQLFVGTEDAINELVFDPFANAHAVVQSWLDSAENVSNPGLKIDEDLVIRSVQDLESLMSEMESSASFGVYDFARPRRNVEIVTENSFNQLFADMHLTSYQSVTGLRSSLFRKELPETSGVFLSYDKTVCTTFFIDYSLKQTSGPLTFVRVGTIKVINGFPQGIDKSKLTDDNTEIWQDDGDESAETHEFSNISFETAFNGDNLEIRYTQDTAFTSEISFTVKRWSM